VAYEIVFVPRRAGASLPDAVAALASGGDVSDAERRGWFDRLVPVTRGVLGDVEVHAGDRAVVHPPTGIRVDVRAGGVVIEVPYEGDADPLMLMTLMHTLAGDVERATGLVGWDPQLGEPVSTRIAGLPRTTRWGQTAADDDDDDGGTAPAAARPPAAEDRGDSTPERGRSWWRFWARR